MLRLNPESAPVGVPEMFQEILTYFRLNQSQFSKRCGWKNSEQLGYILHDSSKPSYATMATIIKTFPELNGDRILRGKGPLLLAELCSDTPVIITESFNDSNWKAIADERLKTIEMLSSQIEFLQKMLIK